VGNLTGVNIGGTRKENSYGIRSAVGGGERKGRIRDDWSQI
jgi:hypothetical protein